MSLWELFFKQRIRFELRPFAPTSTRSYSHHEKL